MAFIHAVRGSVRSMQRGRGVRQGLARTNKVKMEGRGPIAASECMAQASFLATVEQTADGPHLSWVSGQDVDSC